jgi:hypothetical protein
MTATNKRLLISESRGDSNQCTPCREKFDQHATRFPRSVCVWSTTIRISRGPHIATFHTVVNRFEQIHCTREEGSRHNPQHAGRLIHRSVPSFSPTIANRAMEKSQTSVDNWLLGLSGPCHRHAIGTFNTCSRGPTHRSLTDSGGGYNLGGAALSHTHSPTFSISCLPFPLLASSGLQFNQVLTTKPSFEF